MKNTDQRIDQYIYKSSEFARPILSHLRALVHKACPDVVETIKWGFPHFEYHGNLCYMAAFKAHCTFGFWKPSLIMGLEENANKTGEKGMGQFGRIRTIKDLPANSVLLKWIKDGTKVNKAGLSVPAKKKISTVLQLPSYMKKIISGDKTVALNFKKLSPSHKNEYIEWITEAKTETTRQSRLEIFSQWVSEGKSRNWKYMKKKTGIE